MIIKFYDNENDCYARISTEEDIKKIENILNNYRDNSEAYNIDDFLELLEENNIIFDVIPIYDDREIYF
jgi:spore coat polysaccharide biosynthesis protein SpsF (cytidylyltransferase family)